MKESLPRKDAHEVTLAESMEEEMFLGLRKIDGVSMNDSSRNSEQPIHKVYR